jgi:predicted unusual protein kinase regulating ubiquinone biosynthesis (AarF/ABC1/UbiB family)
VRGQTRHVDMKGFAREWRGQPMWAVVRRVWTVASIVSCRGPKVIWQGAGARLRRRESTGRQLYARQVRLGLEELGPTFVKMGQLLSTRSDLLPPSMQNELSLLRDHVSAIPTEDVVAELQRSNGSTLSENFAEFDLMLRIQATDSPIPPSYDQEPLPC